MTNEREHHRSSGIVLAVFLILLGVFLFMKQLGFHLMQPFYFAHEVFGVIADGIGTVWDFLVAWPVLLVVLGLLLLRRIRILGLVLLVIGIILLIPDLWKIMSSLSSLFFPLLLIALGIMLVRRVL